MQLDDGHRQIPNQWQLPFWRYVFSVSKLHKKCIRKRRIKLLRLGFILIFLYIGCKKSCIRRKKVTIHFLPQGVKKTHKI